MRVPTPRALAVVAAVATALLGVLVLVLSLRLEPLARDAAGAAANALFTVGMTTLALTGALVVRAGQHPTMGWLLVVTGLANVLGRLALGLAVAAHEGDVAPLARALGWCSNWSWIPGLAVALVLFLRFPDGHLVSRWHRLAERVIVAWAVVAVVATATVPGALGAEPLAPLTNPFGIEALDGPLNGALSVIFMINPLLVVLVAVAAVLRWRRSGERRPLRVIALALVFLGLMSSLAVAGGQASVAEGLAWLVLPGAVAYAVARGDLWDVDLRRRFDRLRQVREDERERLRRDLHDSLGPLLGSVSLRVEAARNLIAADADRARVEEVLHGIGTQVETAVVEVRRVIDELGPTALADQDLVTALAGLVEDHSTSATRFTLEVPSHVPALSPAAEAALFRVAGEAMRNVVRHADAHECTVRLVAEHGQVGLVVSDDGRGLRGRPPGVGRQAMAARIASVGGTLTVHEAPTGGLRVSARVAVGPS